MGRALEVRPQADQPPGPTRDRDRHRAISRQSRHVGHGGWLRAGERKQLAPAEVRYLECNPDTQSKLSFYDEEYFEVTFPETTGGSGRPTYRQLAREEVAALFDQPKE